MSSWLEEERPHDYANAYSTEEDVLVLCACLWKDKVSLGLVTYCVGVNNDLNRERVDTFVMAESLPFSGEDSIDLGLDFEHGKYYPLYVCPYLIALAAGRRRRRNARGGSRSRSQTLSGSDRTENVPGKFLLSVALPSGTASLAVPLSLDSLGPRLVALGNVFQEHRFVKLRIVLHPGFNTGATTRTSYVVSYYKVIPVTPPVTVANAYSGAVSRYHDVGDTLPITMSLNRSVLMNTVRPWFINGAPSGSELLDSQQGVLFVVNGGNVTNGLSVNLEISYLVQLRGPTLPAVD